MEQTVKGKVYLVGAGPGDPGLVTVRAADLLGQADVVLYDRLVSKKILDMIPKDTRKIYVGRAVGDETTHQDSTNQLMAELAKEARCIVRLKGGDPMIFGRGGEEAEFLRSHDIQYELVPGITSAIASATYSGIPLTHRRLSSTVAFVTGHEDPKKETESVKWRELARSADTIVIMMGLSRIRIICQQLQQGGMDKETPVAVIENGTTPEHRMIKGNISNIDRLIAEHKIRPPSNIIIGRVVDLSEVIGWRQ